MNKKLGHKDIKIKQLKEKIARLEAMQGMEIPREYEKRVHKNYWHDSVEEEIFPLVSEILKKVREDKWSWARNWQCKYIDIRIDMRDGGAILCSSERRISPEQLRYQYGEIDE